jgi:hypothetical protein
MGNVRRVWEVNWKGREGVGEVELRGWSGDGKPHVR